MGRIFCKNAWQEAFGFEEMIRSMTLEYKMTKMVFCMGKDESLIDTIT